MEWDCVRSINMVMNINTGNNGVCLWFEVSFWTRQKNEREKTARFFGRIFSFYNMLFACKDKETTWNMIHCSYMLVIVIVVSSRKCVPIWLVEYFSLIGTNWLWGNDDITMKIVRQSVGIDSLQYIFTAVCKCTGVYSYRDYIKMIANVNHFKTR